VEETIRVVKDMWVVEKVKGEEEVVVMNNMQVMVVAVEETKGWLLEEDR
jgi:hypothetical protein